ncbi:unnamed protein product [Staurois parvus]|uniref:Uncharacterized protein n=1 Tax=Staurois parvus TaxID=386267 RepID=A0ABN9EXN7_9NEOB|nr:unnamed protein product [Staurois parvus]
MAMDRGEFVTFQRAQEIGRLVLGRRIVTRLLCRLCWSREKDGGLGFGEMSPDVRRSRRVREVIWEYYLYGGTGPSVLEV